MIFPQRKLAHGPLTLGKYGKLLSNTSHFPFAYEPNSYSLNYKRISYKVVWVEYPDIEPTMKKLGIAPTDTRPDGSPYYSLPAIWDPATKRGISESRLIAQYLDETYPDQPLLFPPGTSIVQGPWNDLIYFPMLAPLFLFVLPRTTWILNPRSEEYFRKTKSAVKMEDLYPAGEKKDIEWKKVETGFDRMNQWFGKEDGFVMGGSETVTFADFVLGGYLIWLKSVFGPESDEWKDISEKWNGGRWGRFLKSLEQYEEY